VGCRIRSRRPAREALASHFAANGSPVLALDWKFNTAAPLPGLTARGIDLPKPKYAMRFFI
jgi:hypothetical protein